MAIFSTPPAAAAIQVDALPETTTSKPSLIFSSDNCSILTVTLESTTTYQSGTQQRKIRLQKVYVINSARPQEISIQVNYELSNATSVTHPMAKVFSLIVDPHVRNGSTRDLRANPPVFITGSAQRSTEAISQYEAYRLPLLNFKYTQPTLYAVAGGAPEEYVNSFFLLIEFRPDAGAWSFITIASLLSDLLERCPKFFLNLYIVGNHRIRPLSDRTRVKDVDGSTFKFVPTGKLPTDRPATAAERAAEEEALWDQFLLARARSLKEWILGLREFDKLVLAPAVKISPDPSSGNDTVLPSDRNALVIKFAKPDGTPDLARLRSLNLEKAQFAAGAIFIWDITPSILFDTEIVFQTGRSTVYPQDGTYGKDWKKVAERNRRNIDRLRKDLKFLVPGSSGADFTTNLTSVSLRVEGYTDTVGSEASNQLLSEQRAASVITELSHPTPGTLPEGVAGGIGEENFIPPSGIGFGETALTVPTLDEKAEPRNRRVLIRIVGAVCQ